MMFLIEHATLLSNKMRPLDSKPPTKDVSSFYYYLVQQILQEKFYGHFES